MQRSSNLAEADPPALAFRAPANSVPDVQLPGAPSMTDAEIAAAGKVPDGQPVPSRRPRLLAFLFKRTPGDLAAPVAAAETFPEEPATGPVARVGWLFGRTSSADGSAETSASSDAAPVNGVIQGLSFGEVKTICGVSKRELGREVAQSPGSGKYRLYDSDPSSTALRPQFLTGFRDKCARQFSASLVMFGSSEVHEATRYNPLNTNPYSTTDQAYEKTKSKVCGVRPGKNCPENRISRLARNSAFVSVYRGFGDSGDWLEMFLNNGDVAAFEARTN